MLINHEQRADKIKNFDNDFIDTNRDESTVIGIRFKNKDLKELRQEAKSQNRTISNHIKTLIKKSNG